MLRALFGAALVLRLLVDMATPLMPGAFRFDPAESVEAHRTSSVRAAGQAVIRPTNPPPTSIDEVRPPRADVPVRTVPDVRPPRFGPLLARQSPDSAPQTAEDH